MSNVYKFYYISFEHVNICNTFSEHFEEDVSNLWNYEHSVEQYQAFGGTARANIEIQIQQLELWIADSQILTTQV